MSQQHSLWWGKALTLWLTGAFLLTGVSLAMAGTGADIGTVVWQQNYNPLSSNWRNGFFRSVGFNVDGSILASGFRAEADSGSAIGVRYNTATGAVLDTPPEWFLFEDTWSDYAQDRFYDQHIDSSGNIYFVGRSYTASFNAFRPRYDAPSIWKYGIDYTNPDPVTSKPGRPLWRKYYAPSLPSNNDVNSLGEFNGMAVDGVDNIYAVGWFDDNPVAAANRDWIIDKYDSDGNRATGFPIIFDKVGLHDYAYGVATDSEDNFIVVGSVLVDAVTPHHDWVVRKYQGDGVLLWETQYNLANGHDQALYVEVDSDDNVIVSGYRRNAGPADDNDWYVVKYAKNGDGLGGAKILWDQSWDDGSSRHGVGYEAVLDGNDNVYIIGIQLKDSVTPAYSNRYRAVLQYRDGQTGELLKLQDLELIATANNRPELEHDYIRSLALKGGRLVIGGYTQQDGGYTVTRGGTGRVVLLVLPNIFKDGFE